MIDVLWNFPSGLFGGQVSTGLYWNWDRGRTDRSAEILRWRKVRPFGPWRNRMSNPSRQICFLPPPDRNLLALICDPALRGFIPYLSFSKLPSVLSFCDQVRSHRISPIWVDFFDLDRSRKPPFLLLTVKIIFPLGFRSTAKTGAVQITLGTSKVVAGAWAVSSTKIYSSLSFLLLVFSLLLSGLLFLFYYLLLDVLDAHSFDLPYVISPKIALFLKFPSLIV